MEENIKVRWLTDHEQNKIAPKTLASQVLNEDGTLFKDTIATKEDVKSLYEKLESNALLGFYCVEDVTVIVNGVSKTYSANSSVEISLTKDDIFEIIPTSDNSILALTAFPGALGTYYSWLEGVKQFSNILFDMNAEDMYIKWSQGNQGAYQVQFAQYTNCIFWSDNAYINDTARRTNYTLCSSSQLPLCYSNIPDNTFKAFYLAFNVNSDPNWSNPAYKESFAKATWATQVFSYYGARVVGYPGHDSSNFIITLPKDCRGLMFDARNIECAGTFDAANVTNFGAKQGSWKEAFGDCPSLRRLYIKNLKVNLNISWSPVDYASIYYIISEAANTNKITIFVSPYTWNLLSQSDFDFAASKNITITLITTNYVEDKRLNDIANKADKSYVDEKIAALVIPSVEGLATEEYVNEALLNIEENVQPDWNQNDELASDYIKNRPFYEGEDIEKDILPEVTYNCSTDSGITYIQTTDLTLNFKDGVMYDVYINEVVYTLKCNYITEGLKQYTLGDTEFSSAPFHIKYVPMISLFNITFNAQWKESKATICIKERIKNIKKIERKFVNNIAGMDVEKKTFLIDNVEYTASNGAEIFNDYEHNVAVGQYSHAEGMMTAAMGLGSHVEGSLTTASGGVSHSEGYSTTASGEASHAEGFGTTASGNWSHAEGEHTIARGENQHVQGSCNIEDAENRYAHIVGNGEPNARSNAYTLDWDGTAWYQGDVYVGSTSGVNRDEGSKKLLTSDDLIQPDWSQNDENALDCIKNKPFYDTGEYDFIPVFENGVFGRLSSYAYFGDDLMVDFILGAFYKVVFNGVDYICEAKKEGQFVYLGNPVGYLETFEDIFMTDFSTLDWGTGEPFCIFNGTMIVKDGSSVPKLSIYKRKPIINMLDRKYIDYIPGENTSLKKIILDGTEYICGDGSEIFNDYINNKALGEYSHAEGFNTLSSGAYSHTEAYKTVAEGAYAHAEGCRTKAIGLGSHAEGDRAEAKGQYSHAEGQFAVALGNRSHVEGDHTIATGAASHVQGKYNLIDDSAPRYSKGTVSYFDWPEYDGEKIVYLLNQDPEFNNQTGKFTITNEVTEIAYKNLQKDNLFLFTRPENNIISNYYRIEDLVSSREDGNITFYKYKYYKCDSYEEIGGDNAQLAHIIGNGTKEDARSNAHTLDWEGNAWYAGDVYVGSTSGTNKDEGSKKLATEEQIVGKKTEGTVVTFKDKEYTCGTGAEIFNDLSTNLAIGKNSHAEGSDTVAVGMNTHAEGCRAQAIGNFSHAENGAIASGAYSHAEGQLCEAKGGFSHAEGLLTEASAETTHAEGIGSVAMAYASHVQGMYNEIDENIGKTIYAETLYGFGSDKTFDSNTTIYVFEKEPEINRLTGEYTTNSFKEILAKDLQVEDMFALSNTNITQYYWLKSIQQVDENQITGKCMTIGVAAHSNLGKYAHIVGNGGSTYARSNAHTLDWDGNAWYAGSVECTSFILKSSTEGSNKRFRVTIDDNGELHTLEITE